MKVGDMVKVKAQKSFQDDLQDNRICHTYDIGTIAQIVYEDEPNKAGRVFFCADRYDAITKPLEDCLPCSGQYINECDLELADPNDIAVKIDKIRRAGYSLQQAREAIEKCDTAEAAIAYLYIRGDGVFRFHTINGERKGWSDEDYIKYAKDNPWPEVKIL